jgi:hypothetical protein
LAPHCSWPNFRRDVAIGFTTVAALVHELIEAATKNSWSALTTSAKISAPDSSPPPISWQAAKAQLAIQFKDHVVLVGRKSDRAAAANSLSAAPP